MWRVVCIGPGPQEKERRVVDRGPLHPDKQRATAIRDWLMRTGLYESVHVVSADQIATPSALAQDADGRREA